MKSLLLDRFFLALSIAGYLASGVVTARASDPDAVIDFLPTASLTPAIYVEIERDPGFDDFARRMQEAREEYEHYVRPMNHFLEIARQEVRIRRTESEGKVILDLEGEDLLLPRLVIDPEANTVATSTETLPFRSFVELEQASLPPGVHRETLFRTPDTRIRKTKRRQSLLIGEVPELGVGIFHFGLRTPEGNRRIYVRFSR